INRPLTKTLEEAEAWIRVILEALIKVVDYGFNILKLHSIEGQLDQRNKASAAVLIKAGFV
ncbi:MAG TPA: GNAT family N-acetyltransferase, partial [Chitinophagaceae bacterium]|nr:GNAT family N-acetyltransferase [Chitinophagaceae bacterium]